MQFIKLVAECKNRFVNMLYAPGENGRRLQKRREVSKNYSHCDLMAIIGNQSILTEACQKNKHEIESQLCLFMPTNLLKMV